MERKIARDIDFVSECPYSISFPFFFFFLPRTFKLNLVSSRYFIYRGRKIVLFFSLIHFSSNMESRKNRGCRAVEYKKCGGGGTRELYAIENNVACVFCF